MDGKNFMQVQEQLPSDQEEMEIPKSPMPKACQEQEAAEGEMCREAAPQELGSIHSHSAARRAWKEKA
jgi:hypothetical protein